MGIWFLAIKTGTGTDTFTEDLAKALEAQGVRTQIDWLPLKAEYAPWEVPKMEPPPWAEIVHVNTWLPKKFFPKLKMVSTLHLVVHDPSLAPYKTLAQKIYHRLWIKRVEKQVLEHSEVRVAVSQDTAEKGKKAFGKDFKVILNGIDTNFFVPKKKRNEELQALFIGSWSKRKGVDLLAPIMDGLDGVKLKVVASKKAIESVKNAPKSIEFIQGPLSREDIVANLMQESDVLLHPTRLEGLVLVALEAQACGLPVVGSNVSSMPEAVKDGETGFLVAKDDIKGFRRALELLKDPSLRETMSSNARKLAEEKFSLERMAKEYIEAYEEALR